MSPSRILIKNGYIMTMDEFLGELVHGDILIEGEEIRDVATHIDVEDCEVIDATGMIVMPGFVDTHRHTWQTQLRNVAAEWTLFDYTACMRFCYSSFYSADDAHLGNYAGALEALESGITTLVDHSHIMNTPEHADAAVEGLERAGIRAIFCYGMFGNPVRDKYKRGSMASFETPEWHFEDAKRLRESRLSSDDALITMGIALNELEALPIEAAHREISFARELAAARLSCHVAMGALNSDRKLVQRLAADGLLGPDLLFVHGAGLSDTELELLADHGASVAVTPETEVQMGMGHPLTGRAAASGVCTSLGIDIVSNYSGDMFSQMRLGLQMERFRHNSNLDEAGLVPRSVSLSTRHILRIATLEGARAAGLDHRVGSLRPGKQADVILIGCDSLNMTPMNDAAGAVVLSANAANVDTVLVAGRLVKHRGALVDTDLALLFDRLNASRDRIMGGAAEIDMKGMRDLMAPFFPLG